MQFGLWDTIFNVLILVFWFRIWTDTSDRAFVFNPFLAPLGRIGDALVGFVRSAFPALPAQSVAALCIPIIILLRGLVIPAGVDWRLMLGFERQAVLEGAWPSVIFSLTSFAVFLFKIWGISLIYVRGNGTPTDRAGSTLYYLAKPFSDIRLEVRPIVLFIMGVVIAAVLDVAGRTPATVLPGPLPVIVSWGASPVTTAVQLAILSMAGWVQLLLVIQQIMIMLIIGSWVSLFTSSQGLMLFCREWMDLLLGPFRSHRVRVGMIDLSPLVFFIVLMLIHWFLMFMLLASYHVLT